MFTTAVCLKTWPDTLDLHYFGELGAMYDKTIPCMEPSACLFLSVISFNHSLNVCADFVH